MITTRRSHRDVVDVLKKLGFGFYIHQIYGMTFGERGKFDGAIYYFRFAEPDVLTKAVPETQYDFYSAYGDVYVRRKGCRARQPADAGPGYRPDEAGTWV